MTLHILTMRSALARKRTPPSTRLSILMNDIGHSTLFQYLSPEMMYSLASSHGYFYQEIQRFWSGIYTYDRYLEPFMDSTHLPTLWLILQEADALISGSVALQYFAREIFTECDLDIYCEFDRAEHLILFLEKISVSWVKLPRHPSAHEEPYIYTGVINEIINFNVITPKGNERIIQLFLTDGHPMQAVLGFHCSAVMNIITPDVAICLYPHETLYLREAVAFDIDRYHGSESVQKARLKYRSRGWNISAEPSIHSMFDERCGFVQERSLADERTLILSGPLGPSGWLERSPTWLTAFKKLTVTSWSHLMSRNNRVAVSFYYQPHCTSRRGYCFSRDTSMLQNHATTPATTPSVEDCTERRCSRTAIWQDTRAVTMFAGSDHNEVLSCALASFVKLQFERHLPTGGLTAYKLLWSLYPLFRCFRVHPWLVLVFPNDHGPVIVKAIFIYVYDEQGWRAPFRLNGFDTFLETEFGFELIWADDSDDFETQIAVLAPAQVSDHYLQSPSPLEKKKFREDAQGLKLTLPMKINSAIQRRSVQVRKVQPRTDCEPVWGVDAVHAICQYLLDIHQLLALDNFTKLYVDDVLLHYAGRNSLRL
ncbi:hypothetical protein V5O48_007162 [Marasmius crinis-equi]|uniref:Uncharacterized protein n=1 Tax=Marasmius crinis-equi TaxID=585013 RepID=A0ABR3FHK1_9AGAR